MLRRRRSEPIKKALGQRGVRREKIQEQKEGRHLSRQMFVVSFSATFSIEASIRFTLPYVETAMSKEKGYFSFFFFVSISSGARTIDFHNVFGYVNKLVDESLAVHLGQDAALVVIPALTMRERECCL